jgi:hypothetical protein
MLWFLKVLPNYLKTKQKEFQTQNCLSFVENKGQREAMDELS